MSNFINFLLTVSRKSLSAMTEINSEIRKKTYQNVDVKSDGGCGGSPTIADLNFLSMLCDWLNPFRIVEIGTWIGTSALAMSNAGISRPGIYTCDKRKWISGRTLADNPNIQFYHMASSGMLKKLLSVHVLIDLCFIDANISSEDARAICALFAPGKIAIAIHDMDMHNGQDNMARLKACISDSLIFLPEGTPENDRTGFICSRKLTESII